MLLQPVRMLAQTGSDPEPANRKSLQIYFGGSTFEYRIK